MRPYQYCSKKECDERKKLRQVSELEATYETCHLPQNKRILDPQLAVSKYRRSAAGSGGDRRPLRNRAELQRTLTHLVRICSTLQSAEDHPRVKNIDTAIRFVVDRLRACQADATRLMTSKETSISSSWHARVIRVLIWLRYSCREPDTDNKDAIAEADATARTIDHMRSTAYDAYWNSVTDHQPTYQVGDSANRYSEDDEMLCYEAISRICVVSKHSVANHGPSLEISWNSMLLEFSKRRRPETVYPLWDLALRIASHVQREEFNLLWKPDNSLTIELPILAKFILSGEALLPWRYRVVQHYNKSFGKGESVADMNRLLGIGADWSTEYANVFGVPVEESNGNGDDAANKTNSTIIMKLKQVPMQDWSSNSVDAKTIARIQRSDRRWILGVYFDDSSESIFGMLPEAIRSLLKFGYGPSINVDDKNKNQDPVSTKSKIEKSIGKAPQTSSLARALAATKSNGQSSQPSSSRKRVVASNVQPAKTVSSLSRAVAATTSGQPSQSPSSLSRATAGNGVNHRSKKMYTKTSTIAQPQTRLSPLQTAIHRVSRANKNSNDGSTHCRSAHIKHPSSSLARAVAANGSDGQSSSSLSRAVAASRANNNSGSGSTHSRSGPKKQAPSSLARAVAASGNDGKPSTSLSRAVAANRPKNNKTNGSSHSRSGSKTQPRNRPSSLQAAAQREKTNNRNRPSSLQAAVQREKANKKTKVCRFHSSGNGCRFGDNCKFVHEA